MYSSPPDHPKCPGFGLWVYGIFRKRHPVSPSFRFSVLGNEYRVLVSEYRDTETRAKQLPISRNSVVPQTETRALRVVWGAYVHPKKPRKIIGEASFSRPWKICKSGSQIQFFFLPLGAMFGAPTWTKKFKNEFLTLLQAKNNTFYPYYFLRWCLITF